MDETTAGQAHGDREQPIQFTVSRAPENANLFTQNWQQHDFLIFDYFPYLAKNPIDEQQPGGWMMMG